MSDLSTGDAPRTEHRGWGWPWAFWIAVGGCAVAWFAMRTIQSWAEPRAGTPWYNDAIEAHGTDGQVVLWTQLFGCAVGTLAGLVGCVIALLSGSGWRRGGMAVACLLVALASLVTFGAWI